MSEACSCTKQADRYVSFVGIDCDKKAEVIMSMIDKHLAYPERKNKFWDYFEEKRSGVKGPKYDALYMIHSSINQVRELFETWHDTEALALLDRIEEECC